LNVGDHLPGTGLIPAPVQIFSCDAKLDDEVAGQVLWFYLASFFPPQAYQCSLISAHDNSGIGAADKVSPLYW
jgi:hypothetical protein